MIRNHFYIDPGWRNDPIDGQTVEWHQSPSLTTGNYFEKKSFEFLTRVLFFSHIDKQIFVLKYPDDKETLQSSKEYHARLIGTAHLSSRNSPSCLTFTYQIIGDKSNKLSVLINNQIIWRSRLPYSYKYGKPLFFRLLYINSYMKFILVELKCI